MLSLKTATAVAALALAGTAALPADAEAQRGQRGGAYDQDRGRDFNRGPRDRGRDHDRGRGYRWNGPEGYFVIYARACPDIREDRRDRRYNEGRRDRREDRRDRRVHNCPDRAWDYVPSRREARAGRTGERLRPNQAYRVRGGQYYTDTRWGPVPVQVVRGRGRGHGRGDGRHRDRRYGYNDSGWSFRIDF